jgi:bacterioferritin
MSMATSFDTLFRQSPPMGEGADFFIRLKKFAAPEDSMGMEGAPAQTGAPFQDQVLQLMLQMVQNEFKTMLAYKVYAQTMRGPGREGVAKEFEEHAENEIEHADFLLRRLSVLMGGPVPVPDIPPPPPMDNPEEIIHTMIAMEQEGIQNWQNLLGILGDNPTKYEVEAILQRELHHVDELFQFLPPQGGVEGQESGGSTPSAPPAVEQPQAAPATPQAGDGPQSGQAPGVKLSFAKTAAPEGFTSIFRKKIWGDSHTPGAVVEAFEQAMKTAGVVLPDKLPGNVSRNSTRGSSEARTPNGAQNLDVLDAGGKEAATTGLGKPPVVPMEYEPTSDEKGPQEEKKAAAPEHITKAKQRGESNAVARSTQMKGQRGELYGDLVGRLLGGAGGWKAGKVLSGKGGGSLARVIGTGMAQAAGGRVGKQIGREADAARTKSKFGSLAFSKLALEDAMNMLAHEQAAEQAEMANSGAFYAQKAQEHAQARSSLEQQLQQVQQDLQQREQSLQEMQATMSENSAAASQSTTQALLQSVQSNTQAIQQRQLAADAANANMTLRDQLRQLADGPSSGDTQGPGDPQGAMQGPSGGPTSGNGQQALQDGPGNAPPSGESNAYQPIESPQSGGDAKPTGQASLADDGRTPSTPSAYKDGGQGKMGSAWNMPPEMKSKLKGMGLGAAAGAGLFGGATALEAAAGPEGLKQKEQEIQSRPESFRNSMELAKTQSHRAYREAVSEHPVASSASSMIPGAIMGASLGPAAIGAGKKVIQNIKSLRK